MSDTSVDFGKVLAREHAAITKRRSVAGVFQPGRSQGPASENSGTDGELAENTATTSTLTENRRPESLVGLALSGGGLRSAIFNLGLLQAFSHRGLLKYVDYLSSVSGGGYIAGHLAVKASQHTENTSFHNSRDSNLGVCPNSGKHLHDYRFQHAGGYLQDLTGWLGGWIGGTIVTVLFFFTAFAAWATLVALYWRSVDSPWFRSRASVLGIGQTVDELEWAFLPALPILCLWLATLAARWVSRWFGRGAGDWTLNTWGLIALWLALVPVLRIAGLNGRSAATVAFWLAMIPTMLPMTPGFWQRFFLWLGGLAGGVLIVSGLLPLLLPEQISEWFSPYSRGVSAVVIVLLAFGIPVVMVRAHVGLHNVDPDPLRYPCRWMTVAAIATVFISIAVFLGNGVTQISGSVDRYDHQLSLNSTAAWFAAAAGLLQLITFLGMDRLFRSETAEMSSWSRIAFNTIVTSVIVIPLFAIVHWMARENISGFATFRDPDLLATDIRDWNAFSGVIWKLPSVRNIVDKERFIFDDFDDEERFTSLLTRLKISDNSGGGNDGESGENRHSATLRKSLWQTNLALSKTTEDIIGESDWEQREKRLMSLKGLLDRFQLIYLGDMLDDEAGGPDRYADFLIAQNAADHARQKFSDVMNGRNRNGTYSMRGLGDPELTRELLQLLLVQIKSTETPERSPQETPPRQPVANQPADVADEPRQSSTFELTAADRLAIDKWLSTRADDPNDRLMMNEGGTFLKLWDRYTDIARQSSSSSGDGAPGNPGEYLQPLQDHEVRRLNRLLLEALYPAAPYVMILPRRFESTWTVAGIDQTYRVWWLITWLGTLGVLTLIVSDFNRLSPTFRFYRDALERHFLRPDPQSVDHPLLSNIETCRRGMPYHLFAGCLMMRRCGTSYSDTGGRRDYEQPEVERFPFSFSQYYCGVRYTGDQGDHCRTDDYVGGGLQLADAVTISGSAVSPYMTENPWLTWFMSAFNIRLGMWLANPGRSPARRKVNRDDLPQLRIAATPANLFKEWHAGFWRTRADDWNLGFVADGGFRENLGVEELLVRQCGLIIASDAGNNGGQDQFSSLASLVRLARTEYGIAFYDLDHDRPIDLERFRRDEKRDVPQQILCLRIRYPDRLNVDESGRITREPTPWFGLMVYLQMAMTGLEEVDVQQIRKRLPNFPDEPTTNQFYTKEQVEAYRLLGYHIGSIACRELPSREKALSFDGLSTRLKSAFLWECLRESSRSAEDVAVETLFDLDVLDEESQTGEEPKPDEWLTRYYSDADYRNRERQRVYRLLTRDRVPDDSSDGDRGSWTWYPELAHEEFQKKAVPELQGRLLVLAVACHESVGMQAGTRKPSPKADETSGGAVTFRVGGRERFLQLARRFLSERSVDPVADLKGDLQPVPNAEWFRPRERFLLGIRDSVFANRGAEAAAAFGSCLMRIEGAIPQATRTKL